MSITEYLGIGKEHAVPKETLCNLTHMTDRELRKEIELLNKSGEVMVCNLSDGSGYYIPKDFQEAISYRRQEYSRALSNLKKVDSMDQYIMKTWGGNET